jgi:hypothetical protein
MTVCLHWVIALLDRQLASHRHQPELGRGSLHLTVGTTDDELFERIIVSLPVACRALASLRTPLVVSSVRSPDERATHCHPDVGFLFLSSYNKTKDRTTTFLRHRASAGAVGSIQAAWKDQRETEPSACDVDLGALKKNVASYVDGPPVCIEVLGRRASRVTKRIRSPR